MAQTITNLSFQDPSSSSLPAATGSLADQTLSSGTVTTATQNPGIVGLKWMMVRVLLKDLTGLAAADTVTVSVQAGTGASLTTPTNIGGQTRTMLTNDTAIQFQFQCWSNAGFQSFAFTIKASGGDETCIADIYWWAA